MGLLCAIDGCNTKHNAKGFCIKHYSRFRRHGDPLWPTKASRSRGTGSIAINRGYVRYSIGDGNRRYNIKLHVLIAEMAIGKALPKEAVVHHINGVRNDNRNANLLICPDNAYHQLIHARAKAYDSCGNPDWCKCKFCKTYDAIENLTSFKDKRRSKSKQYYHKICARNSSRNARRV